MITEVTLRLFGRPEAVSAAVCPFASMEGATNTVITTIQLGIPVARIEIIDEAQLERSQSNTRKPIYPLAPTLVLRVPRHERCGRRRTRAAWSRRSRPRTARSDSVGRPRSKNARRCGRHATTRSMPRWRCGRARRRGPRTCACRSPLSSSASRRRKTISAASGLVAPLVGHAGDGNFHLIFMLDTDDADGTEGDEGGERTAGGSGACASAARAPGSTVSASAN